MDAFLDQFIGLGVPCLDLADLAAMAAASAACLYMAVHDMHWRTRLLERTWDLAPGGLAGASAVERWRETHDIDVASLGDRTLLQALLVRGGGVQSSNNFDRHEVERLLRDALKHDLPIRPMDGAGKWRQLYRAFVWGEVLRKASMLQRRINSRGSVDRLFVGRNVNWGYGWQARYLELDGAASVLTIYTDGMDPLAQIDLGRCHFISHLHGQQILAPANRAALRWPEDVSSADGSPLEAWRTVSSQVGESHSWSFSVAGVGVDLLFRVSTEAEREAWIERINLAALQGRGLVQLRRDGNFVRFLGAVEPGGAEWQRVGISSADDLLALMYCLGIGLETEDIS